MPPNGVRVHGTPGPIRISEGIHLAIADAPERRLSYRGERVAMFSQFGLLAANAAHATLQQDGASASAEIIIKDIEGIVDIVEIEFNSVSRDVFFSPGYSELTNGDRAAILGKLKVLEAYANDDAHTPAQVESKRASLEAELGGIVGEAFDDIIANGDTYLALLPVITYTRTVAVNFATPFVILDIGKVFSTAAMNQNVPLNPQFAVTEITNTIFANPLQTLGWLKSGRYQIASDGGAQYIQQYTFDAWPTARYTFV